MRAKTTFSKLLDAFVRSFFSYLRLIFLLIFHEESSPSVAADQRSLSQPRLTVGSPEHRISRKLSPVEIYYEMRTRRNSVTSSVRYQLTWAL